MAPRVVVLLLCALVVPGANGHEFVNQQQQGPALHAASGYTDTLHVAAPHTGTRVSRPLSDVTLRAVIGANAAAVAGLARLGISYTEGTPLPVPTHIRPLTLETSRGVGGAGEGASTNGGAIPNTHSAAATPTPPPLGCFPLLSPGTHVGVSYSAPAGNASVTDAMYYSVLAAGARLLQLSLPWNAVEAAPGVINVAMVAGLLQTAAQAGLTPLFNLAAIDTNRVAVPSDLIDPSNPTRLGPNLTWASPLVIYRYALASQALAPLVQFYGGFYYGIGNEVDVNLSAQDDASAQSFAAFANVVTTYIHNITSDDLAVGATMTVEGLASMGSSPPTWFTSLRSQVAAMPLTYYPLAPNMSVITDQSIMNAQVSAAVSLLPQESYVVFQELGFPAGYNNASSVDGSSLAAQDAFINFAFTSLLPAVNASRPLRAVSVFQLVDMPPGVCTNLTHYYNVTSPAFVEYLCTLGLVWTNGTAKPAFETFLDAL